MSKPQKFSVHVICGCYSVFLRHCDMLCSSDFVDDVMFAHNGQKQVVREREFYSPKQIYNTSIIRQLHLVGFQKVLKGRLLSDLPGVVPIALFAA